ncbi:hypothetical protein ACEXQE_20195 [Herbiconiux sp. P17]|uniref:hypothetical protein n=1 Tax=Herbiconiux wuyangfengii TaxID=3342794 RepID=UPI0035B8587B
MSDDTTTPENEPFDQTNGLVEGLHGEDGGTVDPDEPTEPGGLIGGAVRDLGDAIGATDPDDGATPEDRDSARTPYSEEGTR